MAEEQVSVIIRAKDLASAVVKTIDRQFKQFGRDLKAAARDLAALGAAAAGAAFGFAKLVERGGEVENVARAFTRVAGDQAQALSRLRAASQGLVRDYDLMVQFNRAVTLGAADNVEAFAELVEVSIALGRAQGLDAKQSVNDLTLGLARQSRQILDNLGISVRAEEAYKRYADANRIVGRELTDAEKKQAFFTEAMRQARVAVGNLGGTTLNAADKLTQIKIRFQNFLDDTAQRLATDDRVTEFFESLLTALQSLIERLADAAPKLAGFLDQIQLAFGLASGSTLAGLPTVRRLEAAGDARTLAGFRDRTASDRDRLRGLVEAFQQGGGSPEAMAAIMAEFPTVKSFDEALASAREEVTNLGVVVDAADQALQRLRASADEAARASREAAGQSPRARLRALAAQGLTPAAAGEFGMAGITAGPGDLEFREQIERRQRQQAQAMLDALGFGDPTGAEQNPLRKIAEESDEMLNIVAGNVSQMIQRIVVGSTTVEGVVIDMIGAIAQAAILARAQALGSAAGPLGALVGGIVGLAGTLFGRSDRSLPVTVRDYGDRALRQQRDIMGELFLRVRGGLEQLEDPRFVERIAKASEAAKGRKLTLEFGGV